MIAAEHAEKADRLLTPEAGQTRPYPADIQVAQAHALTALALAATHGGLTVVAIDGVTA